MGTFGGKQAGSGRPKGVKARKTQEVIDKAVAAGITPLEYMMRILHDEGAEPSARTAMAIAAAPYVHPKLSSVQANVTVENHEKALSDLE